MAYTPFYYVKASKTLYLLAVVNSTKLFSVFYGHHVYIILVGTIGFLI
ncbi:hypothetical protein P4597_00795 [Peribacillus simplex]|nr:hypothetical protein [Peribacillus simplex]